MVLRTKTALRTAGALVLALALVLGPTVGTHAASWYTWYSKSTISPNTWHSKTMPGQAKYNKAKATTAIGRDQKGLGLTAWVSVSEVGTSTGAGTVTMSFRYQGGKHKCRWTWISSKGKGPLKCQAGWR